jgi:hypothetical protein
MPVHALRSSAVQPVAPGWHGVERSASRPQGVGLVTACLSADPAQAIGPSVRGPKQVNLEMPNDAAFKAASGALLTPCSKAQRRTAAAII